MPIFRKDGRNFLFIHVPKAGGTSIENVFNQSGYERLYLDGKVGEDTVNHVRWCTPQHMHAAMLETNFRTDRFAGVFMVVREPVARLRSEYLWRNRAASPSVDGATVEAWVTSTFRRYAAQPFLFDNHIRPQVEFKLAGAHVFRLETGLPSILAEIDELWDLGLDREIPTSRAGKDLVGHASHDVEITPAARKAIRKFYRRDFAEFGYSTQSS